MEIKKLLYSLSRGFTFLPVYLAVNITNRCNRTCNFCPYHSKYLKVNDHVKWVNRQPLDLDWLEFVRFIYRLGIFRRMIKHVAITGKGEPLLHPDFGLFIMHLDYYKIPFSITTNGDILPAVIKKLSTFKYLTGVRISVYDLADVPKFQALRCKYPFITLFNQTGSEIPGITMGYTVQVEGAESFCSMSKDFNQSKSCKVPFSFLTINTDGSIVPCYSFNETSTIKDSFWKILNGSKIRKYRRDALKMRCEKSTCLNCGVNLKP